MSRSQQEIDYDLEYLSDLKKHLETARRDWDERQMQLVLDMLDDWVYDLQEEKKNESTSVRREFGRSGVVGTSGAALGSVEVSEAAKAEPRSNA